MPRFLLVPLEALLASWLVEIVETTSDPGIVKECQWLYVVVDVLLANLTIGFSQGKSLESDSVTGFLDAYSQDNCLDIETHLMLWRRLVEKSQG